MATGKLQIHSENILPIIKKWLYSERDIFARELVSNGCDALQKIKLLREKGESVVGGDELRLDISIDRERGLLLFSDTGIGMDAEEVERYIAQLAFSGAEEFVEKYQMKGEAEQIIGHFGLGFYSSYMVASSVEIDTLSYREGAAAAHWVCDGGADYTLEVGSRTERGTTITLHLNEESQDLLEPGRLREILLHHCAFLPFSIYLDGERLNEKPPLWMKAPSECTDEEYRDFYRQLYPTEPEPLFWVHLTVDFPFHLKGILYFPKIRRDFDFKSNNIKLFCNRVFVSDNCRDLIPEYLTVLQGAIDSPDIPLNVSRSHLQMDRTVRQLASHISKKVSDRLVAFIRNDRERFLNCWPDLEVIIKLGAIQDEKFYDKVQEALVWKNSLGEWTTLDEYLERNREKHENRVYYSADFRHQPDFLKLYREKGVEVLFTHPSIDSHLIHFLEGKRSSVKFQRIDSELDDSFIDRGREKTVLDGEGKTEATRLADFLRRSLEVENLEVEARSLATDSVAGLIRIDEHARRMRDYLRMSSPESGDLGLEGFLAGKRTFVANTNSPLMRSLLKLSEREEELAKELAVQIYESALLSQRELPPDAMDHFIQRSQELLEKLAVAATK